MFFQKRPRVIEAFQYVGQQVTNQQLPQWFIDAIDVGNVMVHDGAVTIATLEGMMSAALGDWIIKGVQGEIYPIKDDIFRQTYEPVDAT